MSASHPSIRPTSSGRLICRIHCNLLTTSFVIISPFHYSIKEKDTERRMKGLAMVKWINLNQNNKTVVVHRYPSLWAYPYHINCQIHVSMVISASGVKIINKYNIACMRKVRIHVALYININIYEITML